ncbi:hypothetical protein BZG73_10075 [Salinivibrio siamensis]|uniref:Uncharacterized protein n=1 Tax=Salinivibrio siamensis TaxID=414286 RepID=A0ABX3K7N0_9GAMM|nr:hypothetical protein [Salinivibrio siamensis]OOE84206.1 hypothetical protein BZG73_10075 [Salinivibrio siamensis]
MSFKFQESLIKGQEGASLVNKNKKELKEIYTELTNALSEHFGFEVELTPRKEFRDVDSSNTLRALGAAINAWANPEKVATGYTILSLGVEGDSVNKLTLFKYKESDDVYPVTVLFNKDKFLCYDQEEFADAVKKVLENSRLNLELINFKSSVERAKQESSASEGE